MNKGGIISEYLHNDMIKLVNYDKGIYTFDLDKSFGNAKIYSYEVLDGILINYNNYKSHMKVKNEGKYKYAKAVFIVHHCMSGGYRIKLENNMTAIVNKGDSQFYAGCGEFNESDVKIDGYESVSIACYKENFIKVLSRVLSFNKTDLEQYYENLDNFGDILVAKTSVNTLCILEDIIDAFKNQNFPKLKICSYQLIYENIVNYESYVNRFKKLYDISFLARIEEIHDFLRENWKEHYTIEDISFIFAINKTYIKEGFSYMYETGPSTYMRKFRLHKSCELLENFEKSILEIANICGYSNPSKYSKAFKNEFKILPSKYRKTISK